VKINAWPAANEESLRCSLAAPLINPFSLSHSCRAAGVLMKKLAEFNGETKDTYIYIYIMHCTGRE